MNKPNRIWMRFSMLYIILICTSLNFQAQLSLETYAKQSYNINVSGMYALGSWASINLGVGAYYWSKESGEKKYFHQMNFLWNTVNLTLATIGLINNYSKARAPFTESELLKNNIKTEKVFLINSGLDLLYISSGFVLNNYAKNSNSNQERLSGFGKSLILQGGFLLIFDSVMYGLLKHHRNRFNKNMKFQMSIGNDGIGFNIKF